MYTNLKSVSVVLFFFRFAIVFKSEFSGQVVIDMHRVSTHWSFLQGHGWVLITLQKGIQNISQTHVHGHVHPRVLMKRFHHQQESLFIWGAISEL